MTTLFTIPIAPLDDHPGGTITATSPSPQIYLLTISSPPDNRITTPFCHALIAALTRVQHTQPPGVVVTTSALPKFYSNGLDLNHATTAPNFWSGALYALFRKLLSYPMPTIAVLNGHAFAAGLMLSMYHDYRVMNPSRGYLCLNEVDFGALLKPPMSSIFREKVPGATYRSLVLEGKRFNAKEAVEAGILDATGGLEEALALVEQRKILNKGQAGVYGLLKVEMYKETFDLLSEERFEAEERREKANMQWEEDEQEKEKKALAKL